MRKGEDLGLIVVGVVVVQERGQRHLTRCLRKEHEIGLVLPAETEPALPEAVNPAPLVREAPLACGRIRRWLVPEEHVAHDATLRLSFTVGRELYAVAS